MPVTTTTPPSSACKPGTSWNYEAAVYAVDPSYVLVRLCDSRTITSVVISQGGGPKPITATAPPTNGGAPAAGSCVVANRNEVDCTSLNVPPNTTEGLRYQTNPSQGDPVFLTLEFSNGGSATFSCNVIGKGV